MDIANTNVVTVTDGFTVRDLTILPSRANVTFASGFRATNMSVLVSDGATLTFTAGQTYTVNNHLHLRGTAGKLVGLAASGSWNLNVLGYAVVHYASVTSSDSRRN